MQEQYEYDQIICGDCLEILPTFSPGTFHLVFLDPPYNFGVDYGEGQAADQHSDADYLSFIEQVLTQCRRVLHPAGSLWALIPERWADEISRMLGPLPRRNRIIWRETFCQYREDNFPVGHRHLFYHVADPARCTWEPDPIRIPSARMMYGDKRAAGPRVPDTVWDDIARLVGNASERVGWHPCQLPEALLERVILSTSHPDDLVLDPMAGSGTTLRVAQQLKRCYLGIEKNPGYVERIRQRLAQHLQQHFEFA